MGWRGAMRMKTVKTVFLRAHRGDTRLKPGANEMSGQRGTNIEQQRRAAKEESTT